MICFMEKDIDIKLHLNILKAHNGIKVLIEYVKFNFVFSMDFRIEFYNSKQMIFRFALRMAI